ncbi:MAG: tRNA (5-methylaminomethyl-2-thiouridine)(34)-methyltransferase MnmD [Tannerellaceae bacterium]
MERELQFTADGSHTLFIPEMDEHYHSVNGAVQESRHIFIGAGLREHPASSLRVLEVGFGTGLNAFLTLLEVEANGQRLVDYHTVELYPLGLDLIDKLNYGALICPEKQELFRSLHTAAWDCSVPITPRFTLHKIEGDSNRVPLPEQVDLIYFDAFAPEKQPDMWTEVLFNRLFALASPGCIIVTYCAKGVVRRMMQSAGFLMERLPGPPGKRHILRGRKAWK